MKIRFKEMTNMSAPDLKKLTYTYREHSLYVGEETANIFLLVVLTLNPNQL